MSNYQFKNTELKQDFKVFDFTANGHNIASLWYVYMGDVESFGNMPICQFCVKADAGNAVHVSYWGESINLNMNSILYYPFSTIKTLESKESLYFNNRDPGTPAQLFTCMNSNNNGFWLKNLSVFQPGFQKGVFGYLHSTFNGNFKREEGDGQLCVVWTPHEELWSNAIG